MPGKAKERYREVTGEMLRDELARVANFFELLNLKVLHLDTYRRILAESKDSQTIARLALFALETGAPFSEALLNRHLSYSQISQDLVAWATSKHRRSGYFLEIGAANGIDLSNTYMLEKEFGWTGILVEPNPNFAYQISENRKAHFERRAVHSITGRKLDFSLAAELSTVVGYGTEDQFSSIRSRSHTISVEIISLNDLLETYNAPTHIDFLSIDTEGSEFEILSALDWSTYSFGFICCEHNHTSSKKKLTELIESKGYKRVMAPYTDFDAWFINEAILGDGLAKL